MVESRLEQIRRQRAAQAAAAAPRVTTYAQAMSVPSAATGTVVRGLQAPQLSPGARAMRELESEATRTFRDLDMRAKALEIAREGEQPTGIRGLVADVFENPIVSTALKPLQLLDIPRRVVIAGAKELLDGDASWDDFMENVKDPNFGAGDFVNTGNKWADRLLGFVGDVALDPLTYATLGTSQFAGQGGRLALARLAAQDAAISGETVAKIVRYGRAALSSAEVERLGVNRAGVYMFGRRIQGTGRIGQAGDKTMAAVRLAASDSKLGQAVRKAFTPDDFRELRLALANGEVQGARAKSVVRLVTSRDAERAVAGRAQNEAQAAIAMLTQEIGEADMKRYGATIHRLLEAPDVTLVGASAREVEIATRIRQVMDDLWKQVDDDMKLVGEEAGFGKIDNYFPHMLTDAAFKYMNDGSKAYSGPVRELLVNPVAPESIFRNRQLKADRTFFGKKLDESDLNVGRLNEIAREGGFDGDFFETDFMRVADSYTRKYAKQRGVAARLKDLKEGGVLQDLDLVMKNETLYDTDLIKELAGEVDRLQKTLTDLQVRTVNDVQDAVEQLTKMRTGTQGEIGRVVGRVDAATARAVKAGDAARAAANKFAATQQQLAGLRDLFASMIRGGVPPSAQPIVARLEEVGARMEELAVAMRQHAELEDAAEAAAREAQGDLDRTLEFVAQQAAVQQRLVELTANAEKLAVEAGDLAKAAGVFDFHKFIADKYEMALKGKTDGLKPQEAKLVKEIGRWLTNEVKQADRTARMGALGGIAGGLADFIGARANDSDWFKKVTQAIKSSPDTFKNRDEQTVQKSVAALLSDASPDNLLDAQRSAMWAIARDDKAFGENLPPILAGKRVELVETMEAADGALARAALQPDGEVGAWGAAAQARQPEVLAVKERAEPYIESYERLEALKGKLGEGAAPITGDDLELFRRAVRANDPAPQRSEAAEVAEEAAGAGRALGPEDLSGAGVNDRAMPTTMVRALKSEADMNRQIDNVLAKRPTTQGELREMITALQRVMSTRTWVTGQGAGEARYTLEQIMQGEAVLAKRVADAERAVAAQELAAAARTVPEVAGVLARQMSEYMVLSAMHQNFLALAKTYGQHGFVPGIDALIDVTANAAKPLVAQWKARVKQLVDAGADPSEIEVARGVVAKLTAASKSVDPAVYAAMLDDFAGRLRLRLDQMPPATVRDISKIVDSAAKKLRELEASPTYMAGLQEQQVTGMLRDLAGADLHRHVNEDGSTVFLVDGRPLLMPDGTELQFDEVEWQSLFLGPRTAADDEAAAQLDELTARTEQLAAAKQKAETQLRGLEQLRAQRTLYPQEQQWLEIRQRRIPEFAEAIRANQATLSELRQQVAARSDEVRRAAYEKARVLREGNGQQRGWFEEGVDTAAYGVGDPATVAARMEGVDAWWAGREGKKAVDEVAAVSATVDRIKGEGTFSDPQAVTELLARVDDAAKKAVAASKKAQAAADNVDVARAEAQRVARPRKLKTAQAELPAIRSKADEASAWLQMAKDEGAELTGEQQRLAAEVVKLTSDREKAILKGWEDVAGIPQVERAVDDAEIAMWEASAAYDAADVLLTSEEKIAGQVLPLLQDRVAIIEAVLEKAPQQAVDVAGLEKQLRAARGKLASMRKQAKTPSAMYKLRQSAAYGDLEDEIAALKRQVDDAKKAPDTPMLGPLREWVSDAREAVEVIGVDPGSPIAKVVAAASTAELKLFAYEDALESAQRLLKLAESGVDRVVLDRVVSDGMRAMEKLMPELRGLQADPLIAEVLTNMQKLRDPRALKQFNSVLGKYTRFFKAYATLSPGFHVRNAMSNTFMVFAAGSNPKAMGEALGLYRQMMDHVRSGKPIQQWVDSLPDSVRKNVDTAVRAMESAGGGRVEEAFEDFFRKGQRLSDNAATRLSRRAGERVEGSARFMLAYDSAVKGLDFNGATARVKRYLFDYNDVGVADERLRNIVPFWIWMSRNIPLQIVNQWAQPRSYAIYNSFMRNVGERDDSEVRPSWLDEQGAVKIADGWYLAPDFGFTRLSQQLADFADPGRTLSMVNPALRLPIELLGQRRLYNNVPFSERPQQVVGGGFGIDRLLQAVGLADEVGPGGVKDRDGNQLLGEGEIATSDKVNYTLMSLLPMLGQAERVMPSTDPYQDRVLASRLSYAGLPFRQVTDDMVEAETERRRRAIEELARQQQRMGYGG